jgi:hypothetical protein
MRIETPGRDVREVADHITRWPVLAHVVLRGTVRSWEDTVARRHGTAQVRRSLPDHLRKVRRLRVARVV